MQITIEAIRINTIIGFWPEEREKKQPVEITVRFSFDPNAALEGDNIDHSVDYNTLTEEIIESVENTEFNLLERLTQHVLDLVMAHERVLEAEVTVAKPEAPVRNIRCVSAHATATRA